MKKYIAVDFYDLIWQQSEPFSLADMEALFRKYAENGIDAVLWRLSACGKLLYHTKTQDLYAGCAAQGDLGPKTLAVMDAYDPAEAAVVMGKKFGVEA